MSCNICVETFNKSTRKCVCCPSCQFESCKNCWKQFFLGIPERARCMNDKCMKQWSRKDLVSSFDNSFLEKAYKEHVKTLLYDIEKSLLPQTQVIVERRIKADKIDEQIAKIHLKIERLRRKRDRLRDKNPKEKERSSFIRHCPSNDCRGFLSTQLKCGICGIDACKDCHEVKEDEHKCNPDNVETAKLLNKDTKGCPSCGTMIFKINGCDQMFCTSCNTAFSWKTCKVENGIIHNPHYFEWMRRNGNNQRNVGDIQCGREITMNFSFEFSVKMKNIEELDNECRFIIHIRQVAFPYLREPIETTSIRIDYLMKIIDEKRFKMLLHKKKKQQELNNEVLQIWDMYVNAATDILFRFRDNYRTKPKKVHWGTSVMYDELNALKDYKDKCLEDLCCVYKTNFPNLFNKIQE